MRLDLEVLALAEDVLREEARLAAGPEGMDSWGEQCEHVADRIADIIDHLDQDG